MKSLIRDLHLECTGSATDGPRVSHFPGDGKNLMPMPLPSDSAEEYALNEEQVKEVLKRGTRLRFPARQPSHETKQWMHAIVIVLNVWYIGKCRPLPPEGRPTTSQKYAYWHMMTHVMYALEVEPISLPQTNWSAYLRKKNVTYQGEAVQRARRLTWRQVLPSLPPAERCASVDLAELCAPAVRRWLQDPMATLVDFPTVAERPRPGAMLGDRSELITIFQGLYDRNLVVPLRRSAVLEIHGIPLLNGIFGVGERRSWSLNGLL